MVVFTYCLQSTVKTHEGFMKPRNEKYEKVSKRVYISE